MLHLPAPGRANPGCGRLLCCALLAAGLAGPTRADRAAETAPVVDELAPITVRAEKVANLQPVGGFPAVATALRFDPRVDLQSRGLPEGQADVSVRGGLFENTGFRIGAVTVFDPQTGHYAVELPIDPAMLSTPAILTDVAHGAAAFNASVATVQYDFRPVQSGGTATAGAGTDDLRHARARTAVEVDLGGGRWLGAELSAAASRGDGSLPFGDHDFRRFSGRLQIAGPDSDSHLLLGYQDKFFGWPGAYTGFASLPETDDTQVGLLLFDHRRNTTNGWLQLGAAYRWLQDDYDFDRRTSESGVPGAFEHASRSFALGVAGEWRWRGLELDFSGQFSADRLTRSTDLTSGRFNSRSYLNLSLLPGKRWTLRPQLDLVLRAGLRADLSNRDENALLPLASLALEKSTGRASSRLAVEYSQVSQLPGYTALNSPPNGLFGGNADLGREYADTLTLSISHQRAGWEVRASFFRRRDDGLIDWTFLQDAPFARQANPVDLNVTGFEGYWARRSPRLDLVLGYAWLDKDEDYRQALVDASFYALNFARHRATLAIVWRPVESIELRLDNEYRRQRENLLRRSRDKALLAMASLHWTPPGVRGLRLSLAIDNLGDSDFEELPGTPASGRQASVNATLNW